jgi:hypothetical protein
MWGSVITGHYCRCQLFSPSLASDPNPPRRGPLHRVECRMGLALGLLLKGCFAVAGGDAFDALLLVGGKEKAKGRKGGGGLYTGSVIRAHF